MDAIIVVSDMFHVRLWLGMRPEPATHQLNHKNNVRTTTHQLIHIKQRPALQPTN